MTALRLPVVALLVAAAPSLASAHGGGYATRRGGPQASPGFGDSGAPVTRWETWWAANREDLLKIAERVDAARNVAVTPNGDVRAVETDPVRARANFAALARGAVLPVLLRKLAEDKDFDVRCSAAIALGKLGDPVGSAPLRDVARRDERADVRRAALLALGILGRFEDLPFLGDVVRDRNLDVEERGAAVLAMGLTGGDDAAAFLADFVGRAESRPDTTPQAAAELAATGLAALGVTGADEALHPLRAAADDETLDPFLRGHAVLSLGRLRDRDSLGRLARLVGRPADVQVRRCAALALGRVVTGTDGPAIAALTSALDAEVDPAARRFAIESLGVARCAAVRDLLLARLRGPSPDRAFLALALGLQRDPLVAPAVVEAMKVENDVGVRSACCTALGLLGDVETCSALEAQLDAAPTRGAHRGFAAMALAVLPSPASRDAIWKRLQTETDARVRADYSVALGLMNDGRIKAFLVDHIRTGDGAFDKATAAASLGVLRRADAVPDLVAVIDDPDVDGIVRAICVVALGQIADPSLVPKLSRLSAGGDSTLATKALAEALTIL
jgi:HEAT repeat protein